ncbi:MAG: 1-hydroxycarotenoid 3,4-desaturase CrtD [Pseudomonadota bacterium]
MKQPGRVVIIGAGIGGLAAGAILSRDFAVDIVEARDRPGGKMRQIEIDDARIDSGPTVFTMKWVFEDLFRRAGASFEDCLTLNQLEILARHGWRDGSQLDLYADIDRSAEAIAEFAGTEDGENYRAFCRRTEKAYRALKDSFLRAPKPSFASLMTRANPFDVLATAPFSTLWNTLGGQFHDPRLRQLFGRYSTYCGSSPFRAPGTLMLIAHVEQAGVWSLEGGMHALAQALADIIAENGGRIHYGAPASKISKIRGGGFEIEIAGGDAIKADSVVFNGDRAALAGGLMGAEIGAAVPGYEKGKRSQSAITWSAVAKTRGFDLATHSVFFSDDYEREFTSVFDESRPPEQPTTYIFAPDRDHAPGPQGENERLFILINAPASDDPKAYDKDMMEACWRRTRAHLKTCGLEIDGAPERRVATSPSDFGAMFPGTGGALYGMATHGWQASFQRPGVKTRAPGLYAAGGSVHPGPGVPMAALSGMAAAEAIKRDRGLT